MSPLTTLLLTLHSLSHPVSGPFYITFTLTTLELSTPPLSSTGNINTQLAVELAQPTLRKLRAAWERAKVTVWKIEEKGERREMIGWCMLDTRAAELVAGVQQNGREGIEGDETRGKVKSITLNTNITGAPKMKLIYSFAVINQDVIKEQPKKVKQGTVKKAIEPPLLMNGPPPASKGQVMNSPPPASKGPVMHSPPQNQYDRIQDSNAGDIHEPDTVRNEPQDKCDDSNQPMEVPSPAFSPPKDPLYASTMQETEQGDEIALEIEPKLHRDRKEEVQPLSVDDYTRIPSPVFSPQRQLVPESQSLAKGSVERITLTLQPKSTLTRDIVVRYLIPPFPEQSIVLSPASATPTDTSRIFDVPVPLPTQIRVFSDEHEFQIDLAAGQVDFPDFILEVEEGQDLRQLAEYKAAKQFELWKEEITEAMNKTLLQKEAQLLNSYQKESAIFETVETLRRDIKNLLLETEKNEEELSRANHNAELARLEAAKTQDAIQALQSKLAADESTISSLKSEIAQITHERFQEKSEQHKSELELAQLQSIQKQTEQEIVMIKAIGRSTKTEYDAVETEIQRLLGQIQRETEDRIQEELLESEKLREQYRTQQGQVFAVGAS